MAWWSIDVLECRNGGVLAYWEKETLKTPDTKSPASPTSGL